MLPVFEEKVLVDPWLMSQTGECCNTNIEGKKVDGENWVDGESWLLTVFLAK